MDKTPQHKQYINSKTTDTYSEPKTKTTKQINKGSSRYPQASHQAR